RGDRPSHRGRQAIRRPRPASGLPGPLPPPLRALAALSPAPQVRDRARGAAPAGFPKRARDPRVEERDRNVVGVERPRACRLRERTAGDAEKRGSPQGTWRRRGEEFTAEDAEKKGIERGAELDPFLFLFL